ncbi:hypothetical protein [Vibrio phage vB_VmeM-Yong XC32]|nr:hypothetical protein [Vibrio phage vB_VmeM-Yong XC31]QAX96616.1 hypothetical protein [Vibrio phage vB_VmeM-Yong XC32]QAX96934.1 hypothetical protein [Vibrio phage vB_VmeM-Yong MS31]QAX97239.1 hypothetical protein [Vibrio phage vB_VmeM-Yong MS32]
MNHVLKALILDLNQIMDTHNDTDAVITAIGATALGSLETAFQTQQLRTRASLLVAEAVEKLPLTKIDELGKEIPKALQDLMDEGCPKGRALDVLRRRIAEVIVEAARTEMSGPNVSRDSFHALGQCITHWVEDDARKAEAMVNFLNDMYRADHFEERKPRLPQWIARLPTDVVQGLYVAFSELVGANDRFNPSMHLARVVEVSSKLLAAVRPSAPSNLDTNTYAMQRPMPNRQMRGRMQALPEGETTSQPTEHAYGSAKIAAEHNLLEELGKFLQTVESALGGQVKVMTFDDGELKELSTEELGLSKFIDENLSERKVKGEEPEKVIYNIHASWVAKALELNYKEFILHFGEDGMIIELMHPRTHREKPDSVAVARCTFDSNYALDIEWLYSANQVFDVVRPTYHVVKLENLCNYELPNGWFWNDNSVIDGRHILAYEGK